MSLARIFIAGLACVSLLAQGKADLTQMNLEDLMNIQVTSVAKKEQSLSKTGAAVYVITAEEIHRSGATNIPDLLRMAPGVHVARMDANTWAISIRGFTDRYGDKVLVLIDGRSVYSPTSSGVNWDQQDVPLEDIERIEIIRGPGGTAWGANAVNGVISIITKSAKATPGGLVSAGGGSRKNGQGLVQYGGQIGAKGTYRAFADYSNFGNSASSEDQSVTDGWHKSHGGFRSDWDLGQRDKLTVQGDLFQAREAETMDTLLAGNLFQDAIVEDKITVGSGDVLSRWDHTLLNGSVMSLQGSFERYHRVAAGLGETRNTFDLDFQHHLSIGLRNDVVWGLAYRVSSDATTPGYAKSLIPSGRTDHLYSAFLQDEIRINDSLSLTLGSKFEHNAYTGLEYEPSAQLVWTLTPRQAVWVSAARAIRQPAQADVAIQKYTSTFQLDNGTLGVNAIVGTPGRGAERLLDFEAGYRVQATRKLSFDLAGFSSYYHGLQTAEPGIPYFTALPLPYHLVVPTMSDAKAHAHNYGGEFAATWNVTGRWKISPSYSFLQMHVAGDPASQDEGAGSIAALTPKHQFQVHSFLNLTRRLDWDCALYYVAHLGGEEPIPSYFRVDTRLGWRVGESLEFSVTGQNLQARTHAEFGDDEMFGTLAARSVFARVAFHF